MSSSENTSTTATIPRMLELSMKFARQKMLLTVIFFAANLVATITAVICVGSYILDFNHYGSTDISRFEFAVISFFTGFTCAFIGGYIYRLILKVLDAQEAMILSRPPT